MADNKRTNPGELRNTSGMTISKFLPDGSPLFQNPKDGSYHTVTGETMSLKTGRALGGDPNKYNDQLKQPAKSELERASEAITSYKTGSQVTIYFGPILVDEIIQIEWKNISNISPLYSYNSRYYNTLLEGNFLIQGRFAILFKETDYIKKVLAEYETLVGRGQLSSISDIVSQKRSKFMNTLEAFYVQRGETMIDGRYPEDSSIIKAKEYVDKIIKEGYLDIEYNTGEFNLGIIYGNYLRNDFALRSFKDVKIIGSGQSLQVDDNVIVEIYDFVARELSLPERARCERQVRIADNQTKGITIDPVLEKSKLEEGLRQFAKTIDIWPAMRTWVKDRYKPGVLSSVDHVAMFGLPNETSGIYGHNLQLAEISYEIFYDKLVNLENINRINDTQSRNIVDVNNLQLPNYRLLMADPDENLNYIRAISNVYPKYYLGDGIPPTQIPLVNFEYVDADAPWITNGVLWSGLMSSEKGEYYPTKGITEKEYDSYKKRVETLYSTYFLGKIKTRTIDVLNQNIKVGIEYPNRERIADDNIYALLSSKPAVRRDDTLDEETNYFVIEHTSFDFIIDESDIDNPILIYNEEDSRSDLLTYEIDETTGYKPSRFPKTYLTTDIITNTVKGCTNMRIVAYPRIENTTNFTYEETNINIDFTSSNVTIAEETIPNTDGLYPYWLYFGYVAAFSTIKIESPKNPCDNDPGISGETDQDIIRVIAPEYITCCSRMTHTDVNGAYDEKITETTKPGIKQVKVNGKVINVPQVTSSANPHVTTNYPEGAHPNLLLEAKEKDNRSGINYSDQRSSIDLNASGRYSSIPQAEFCIQLSDLAYNDQNIMTHNSTIQTEFINKIRNNANIPSNFQLVTEDLGSGLKKYTIDVFFIVENITAFAKGDDEEIVGSGVESEYAFKYRWIDEIWKNDKDDSISSAERIKDSVWSRNFTWVQTNIPPSVGSSTDLERICYFQPRICNIITYFAGFRTHLNLTKLVNDIYDRFSMKMKQLEDSLNGGKNEIKAFISKILEEELINRGQTAKFSITKRRVSRSTRGRVWSNGYKGGFKENFVNGKRTFMPGSERQDYKKGKLVTDKVDTYNQGVYSNSWEDSEMILDITSDLITPTTYTIVDYLRQNFNTEITTGTGIQDMPSYEITLF